MLMVVVPVWPLSCWLCSCSPHQQCVSYLQSSFCLDRRISETSIYSQRTALLFICRFFASTLEMYTWSTRLSHRSTVSCCEYCSVTPLSRALKNYFLSLVFLAIFFLRARQGECVHNGMQEGYGCQAQPASVTWRGDAYRYFQVS